MGDTKKYYWLKLDKNFFKRHDIRIVESMPNGKAYILLYLKLLLESIDHEGLLRFNESIPYNEDMIATITDTNVDIVRSGLKLFSDLKLLDVTEDKTIHMVQTVEMLGESTSTHRVKAFRERQKLKQLPYNETLHETLHETEIEKEIELEIDIERESKKKIKESGNGKSSISRPSPVSKPSISEISEFLKSLNLEESKIDFGANKFFNYYEARGWFIDGQPIYDWKSLIQYWLDISVNRSKNGYSGKKVAPVPEWMDEFKQLLDGGN